MVNDSILGRLALLALNQAEFQRGSRYNWTQHKITQCL